MVKDLVCEVCRAGFFTKQGLTIHKMDIHQISNRESLTETHHPEPTRGQDAKNQKG